MLRILQRRTLSSLITPKVMIPLFRLKPARCCGSDLERTIFFFFKFIFWQYFPSLIIIYRAIPVFLFSSVLLLFNNPRFDKDRDSEDTFFFLFFICNILVLPVLQSRIATMESECTWSGLRGNYFLKCFITEENSQFLGIAGKYMQPNYELLQR